MKRLRRALTAIRNDKWLCVATVVITAFIFGALMATPTPWYIWVGLLSYYPLFVLGTAYLDAGDNGWLYPGIKDEEADS